MDSEKKTLSLTDSIAIIMGIVIGAGIFRTPSLVAANSGSGLNLILVWIAGGAISIIGALCYSELASAYPNAGGDYHFIHRAFGRAPAFLFAWARMTVIQTGSIAMLAFILGDYASEIFHLGSYSSPLYALITVAVLTGLNITGVRQGSWMQKVFTLAIVLGLFSMIAIGIVFAPPAFAGPAGGTAPSGAGLGKAMIFVLLTYGGWNEAAYLSSELQGSSRAISRALIFSLGAITLIYVSINLVFLAGLGLGGMSGSEAVAADLMRHYLGNQGAWFISLLVIFAALSTINGSMITGARTNYALGRDFSIFHPLAKWEIRTAGPVNAFIVQGAIALVLVGVGTFTRSGFVMMVEYTAPIFWSFFLLVGLSLLVLRRKEPERVRPFRVPFYPATPVLFCGFCLYMLQASLAYTGIGAVIGIGVLLAGIPFFILNRRVARPETVKEAKWTGPGS